MRFISIKKFQTTQIFHFFIFRFSTAYKSFENAHREMRGKSFIDYRPLGLNHILNEWQV